MIDAVGANVVEFQIGDAVCAYLPLKRGGYAEAVCSHAAFVARKPKNVSFTHAAAMPLAGLTALACVGDGVARYEAPLFIAGGSGGVGSFALELARFAGAYPIITTAGTASSATYLTQTLGMSADQILRYEDQERLSSKSAAFRFVSLRARAKSSDPSIWGEYNKGLTRLLDLVSRDQIRLPKIGNIGPLSAETVRAAHRLLAEKHVQGKLVMTVP